MGIFCTSLIYLGADEGGYICLPRGLRDQLQERCRQANIPYAVTDKRTAGRKLGIAFRGKLLDNQENAVNTLLKHDCGILCAATGFGKTVLCCSIIARIKLPALVILESSALLDQWVAALDSFLDIREPLPQYKTKTGLIKTRKSVIGTIHGGRDTSAGIIDVAMPGSLYKKGMFHERLREYGLILVDECHHSAAGILRSVLEEVSAKFVYGVTATPFRGDGLERINEMLLGGIRFRYTAMEKAQEMGIPQWVIPRFTRTVCPTELDTRDIFKFYELVSSDEIRNRQIADDIRMCVADGRTPVVLTNFRNHAGQLYDLLRDAADYVFLLTGDLKKDEQNTIRQQMNAVTAAETMILIATGNLIGEGFDFPRLDTLIMATPVSFKGRVEQYAGRLNRYYEGKKDVRIYDYIDVNITVFERMYLRRFKTYKRIGYEIYSDVPSARQEANAIFDADNYSSVYEKDLRESSFSIVISSPTLSGAKVFHMLDVLKPRQEAGVMVTVVTWHPDYYRYGHDVNRNNLLERIKNSGISIAYAKNGCKHYAVIDNEVVWYGSINLLSKESDDDGMMRIVNKKIAAELLEVTFRKDEYVWC